MNTCRICLESKKSLISIYKESEGLTLAKIMCLLANIKILHNDEPERICASCRNSLLEAYKFKLLIEKSDSVLHGNNTNVKKLNFSDVNDLKLKIDIESEDIKPKLKQEVEISKLFKEDCSEISYNDVVIRKPDKIDIILKPIPVLDFLQAIKDEADDENDFNFDNITDMDVYGELSGNDSDYTPSTHLMNQLISKKKKALIKKAHTKCIKESNGTSVCIKPITLNDLKLVPAYSKKGIKCNKQSSDKNSGMCPYCGKMFKSIKVHILRKHTEEKKYKCDICVKAFTTSCQFELHKRRHSATKSFKCDQCTAEFFDKGSLSSHKKTHSTEKKFVCDLCNKGFKRSGALQRHKKRHNFANKNVTCDLCNMSFFCNYGLRHHMRVHTGERPYNCEICSQPYSYKHDFNRHCLKKHGVFFKRRSVYVMNEEVLKREKILMKELMLRVNGIINDGKPLNPFEGPQATLAFEQAIAALHERKIPLGFLENI